MGRYLVDIRSGDDPKKIMEVIQGKAIRLEIGTGFAFRDGQMVKVCQATLQVKQHYPSGSQRWEAVCMPFVEDSYQQLLTTLGQILDDHTFTDIRTASG